MPASAHTYRLFVSSTFLDFAAEREALHRHVFPALEELCRSAGARFQAVDLRWGISPEAEREQQTLAICLAEIDRSRRVTPRPNFLILLGDRYGWQPPPAEIPALDFEEGLARVTDAEERERFSNGYRRDDNSQPPVYLLQPRPSEAGPSESSTRAERRLAARLAELGSERGSPYQRSATEHEIVRGALEPSDAAAHALCVHRRIEGLPRDAAAAGFIDLRGDQPDPESAARLADLSSVCATRSVRGWSRSTPGGAAMPRPPITSAAFPTRPRHAPRCWLRGRRRERSARRSGRGWLLSSSTNASRTRNAASSTPRSTRTPRLVETAPAS